MNRYLSIIEIMEKLDTMNKNIEHYKRIHTMDYSTIANHVGVTYDKLLLELEQRHMGHLAEKYREQKKRWEE